MEEMLKKLISALKKLKINYVIIGGIADLYLIVLF